MCQGKQSITRFPSGLVFRAKAQETGDQDQKRISVGLLGDDAEDRFLPSANLLSHKSDRLMDFIPAHQTWIKTRRKMTEGDTNTVGIGLVRSSLRKPFLTTPLCLTLFGFLPDTGLLIETTALELAK